MIVLYKRKFFDCSIKFSFCMIVMLVDKVVLQCIEVSLRWCIIVRISGFAHALSDAKILTEFSEFFRSVLTSLIVT